MSIPSRLDLESQLFAILKTLKTIHEDMISGKTSYSSYCNIVRQKINDLMVVELTFQAKGLEFSTILNDMMVSEEFFSLIPQIHEFITLTEKDQNNNSENPTVLTEQEKNLAMVTGTENKTANFGRYTINPILLADLASKITSNFITIFDFFKLEMKDPQLLQDSFQLLEKALKEFPGLEDLYLDFKSLARKVTGEIDIHETSSELYQSFEKLYRRFLAFLKNPSNL